VPVNTPFRRRAGYLARALSLLPFWPGRDFIC
jgi:hypothetical protein